MKKLLIFLLAAMMIVCSCACGKENNKDSNKNTKKPRKTSTAVSATTDPSEVTSTSLVGGQGTTSSVSEEEKPTISHETDVTNGSMTEGTDSTTGTDTGDSSATGSTTGSTTGTASRPTNSTGRPTGSATKPSTSTNTSTSTSTPTKPTTPTACQHVYASKVLKDPTCTDYGLTKRTCEKCGYSYTENTMPIAHSFSGKCGSKCQTCDTRLQHKWNSGVVLQKPTCDKQGNILYTCTVCGDEHYDRSAHNAGNTNPVDIRKEPCVESGEAWYKCQDCGELFLKDMFPIGYHVDYNGDNQCDGCGEHIDE